jgi:hypothetical protein
VRLETDQALREALHGMYVALFRAKQACPEDFPIGRLTTILTAIMGVENLGWRVVGLTREALELLSTTDYNKKKLPRQLCRGHIIGRIETVHLLFEHDEPLTIEEYFRAFLQGDRTVIMLNEQDTHSKVFPEYIQIDNPSADLFPNGSLVSWKHRKNERNFLRQLHISLREGAK